VYLTYGSAKTHRRESTQLVLYDTYTYAFEKAMHLKFPIHFPASFSRQPLKGRMKYEKGRGGGDIQEDVFSAYTALWHILREKQRRRRGLSRTKVRAEERRGGWGSCAKANFINALFPPPHTSDGEGSDMRVHFTCWLPSTPECLRLPLEMHPMGETREKRDRGRRESFKRD